MQIIVIVAGWFGFFASGFVVAFWVYYGKRWQDGYAQGWIDSRHRADGAGAAASARSYSPKDEGTVCATGFPYYGEELNQYISPLARQQGGELHNDAVLAEGELPDQAKSFQVRSRGGGGGTRSSPEGPAPVKPERKKCDKCGWTLVTMRPCMCGHFASSDDCE
jgi:hypothetical protein